MIATRLQSSFAVALGLGFMLGACFDGLAAEGLPCETDAQCGPRLSCVDNYCGGVFGCADGSMIELSGLCDGTLDCSDGADEDSELCGIPLVNQCEAEPDQPLEWIEGPAASGAADPLEVVAENFVGDGRDEFLIAGADGMFVKIVDFGMGPDSQQQYYLNGDPPSFGARTVADFEVADLEGDGDLDVVVVADGDGVGVYTFENTGSGAPEAFGPPGELPVPDVEVRGLELGRFDEDTWIDLVAVVDVGDNKGQVFTGVGDPLVVPASNYFSPEFSMVQLDYVTYFDSAAADVDQDGLDDLIVTGEDASGPKLWVVQRNGVGISAWAEPIVTMMPGPAVEIAVGLLEGSGDPDPDLVTIDGNGGRIVPFINDDGNFMPRPPIEGFGTGLSGITVADVNCDGLADFLVNVSDPAELRVWLGDGQGGVVSDVELTMPSPGVARGGLAVAQFDQDQTWDIIQALDAGNQLADPQLQVWFTSDPMAGNP